MDADGSFSESPAAFGGISVKDPSEAAHETNQDCCALVVTVEVMIG